MAKKATMATKATIPGKTSNKPSKRVSAHNLCDPYLSMSQRIAILTKRLRQIEGFPKLSVADWMPTAVKFYGLAGNLKRKDPRYLQVCKYCDNWRAREKAKTLEHTMGWYYDGRRKNQKPTAAQTLACLQEDLLLEPAEDMMET